MQDHILIVDDDRQETMFLERFFTKNGYKATGVFTSTGMFEALEREDADLIVLDIILPDENGLDAARRLQRERDVPIIMLSARDEVFDRVIGLEVGADDYVTKPYEPRELLARVRSVLRRYKRGDANTPLAEGILRVGDLEMDFTAQRAFRVSDGADLKLTHSEFNLLKAIVAKDGAVMTRLALLESVHGEDPTVTDRAVDAHIARLRRKLGQVADGSDLIATVHGTGYRLARVSQSVPFGAKDLSA